MNNLGKHLSGMTQKHSCATLGQRWAVGLLQVPSSQCFSSSARHRVPSESPTLVGLRGADPGRDMSQASKAEPLSLCGCPGDQPVLAPRYLAQAEHCTQPAVPASLRTHLFSWSFMSVFIVLFQLN